MIVTFIGIVVPLIDRMPMLVAALVAIAVGLLARDMPHNLGLIVASIAGVVAGFVAESTGDCESEDAVKTNL